MLIFIFLVQSAGIVLIVDVIAIAEHTLRGVFTSTLLLPLLIDATQENILAWVYGYTASAPYTLWAALIHLILQSS